MPRHHYVLSLPGTATGRPAPAGANRCGLDDVEREALAQLMLDAYCGTIDYEGETLAEARAEIAGYFAGHPLLGLSAALCIDGAPAAALFAAENEGQAFVAYVITAPEFKARGFAGYLLDLHIRAATDAGYDESRAFITEGNTPSEALFRRAGFVRVPGRSNALRREPDGSPRASNRRDPDWEER